jgi:menaquinone-dependent protoporphyrinogen oxidase
VRNAGSYDAVVAGSAVYIGKMRKEMRRFLQKNEQVLKAKPVWLFVSGPTEKGDDPGELDGWHRPASMKNLLARLSPKDQVVFTGAVSLEKMSGLEKWMMTKVKSPLGDAREWDKIEEWARNIATAFKG